METHELVLVQCDVQLVEIGLEHWIVRTSDSAYSQSGCSLVGLRCNFVHYIDQSSL